MTSDIHIIVTSSPNYEDIYSYFKESLKNRSNNIHIHEFIINMDAYNNDGSFRSDGWYFACRERLRNLLQFIILNPNITYVIFSDADINYLNPNNLQNLIKEAESQDLDYYGMREGEDNAFNGGFYVLKNNIKTQRFLNHIIHELIYKKPDFADQSIINHLLIHNNIYQIKYDFIPVHFYVWGDSEPTKEAIFHHAVACQDKIAQIKKIKDKYTRLFSNNYEHFINHYNYSFTFTNFLFIFLCILVIFILSLIKQIIHS